MLEKGSRAQATTNQPYGRAGCSPDDVGGTSGISVLPLGGSLASSPPPIFAEAGGAVCDTTYK
jgi:hypothetical protein